MDKQGRTDAERLGIETDSLVGQTREQVAGRIGNRGAAILTMRQGVPDEWPSEILRLDESADTVDWYFQGSDGEWRQFHRFRHSEVRSHASDMGFVYTRVPVEANRYRVKPVALIEFSPDGIVTQLRIQQIESQLDGIAHNERRQSQEPIPYRHLPEREPILIVEKIEHVLGLPLTRREVRSEGFPLGKGTRFEARFHPLDEGRQGVAILGVDRALRVAVFTTEVTHARLGISDPEVNWPLVEVAREGIRIALGDVRGDCQAIVDVYGGWLDLTFLNEGVPMRIDALALIETSPEARERGIPHLVRIGVVASPIISGPRAETVESAPPGIQFIDTKFLVEGLGSRVDTPFQADELVNSGGRVFVGSLG